MNTVREVLQFVRDNQVKFVRLTFADLFGTQKNITLVAEELPRAFEHGVSFDASAVAGFMNVEESDLFLFPDPSTVSLLPWRSEQGATIRFFCNIRRPDGTPFEGDCRNLLLRAQDDLARKGYLCQIGSECEFYLFEKSSGQPQPLDRGGYMDVSPLDKGEDVRKRICVALEALGIQPLTAHHEQGPGQNEIDFRYNDAAVAADDVVTFRTVVRTVADTLGLTASFLPKPLPDAAGSGMHVNLSLLKNGENLFARQANKSETESFIAGILNRIKEISLFCNPLANSYERLGEYEAPRYVSWSRENRSQLVRIPAASGADSRMELRSPDPSCNPYLAYALILRAGAEGLEHSMRLAPPADLNLYEAIDPPYEALPADLGEAIAFAERSDFVRTVLPHSVFARFLAAKKQEWEDYQKAIDKREYTLRRYLSRI